MLFVVLLSFAVFNNAIPLSKVNSSHPNFLQQILAHKDDSDSGKSLMSMFSKVNPAEIANIISMIQALLSSSTADLNILTTAVADATGALDAAETAHNAAILAQVNGVSASQDNLDVITSELEAAQTAHDQLVISLQGDVDSSLAAKVLATAAKASAVSGLDSQKPRLDAEIVTLNQVIEILSNFPTENIPIGDLFVIDGFTGVYANCVAHCEGLTGGTYKIASVHSDAENDQLISQLQTTTYIGAVETSVDTVYEWADGSPWDYTPPRTSVLGLYIKNSQTRIALVTDGMWTDYGQAEQNFQVACRKH